MLDCADRTGCGIFKVLWPWMTCSVFCRRSMYILLEHNIMYASWFVSAASARLKEKEYDAFHLSGVHHSQRHYGSSMNQSACPSDGVVRTHRVWPQRTHAPSPHPDRCWDLLEQAANRLSWDPARKPNPHSRVCNAPLLVSYWGRERMHGH